MRIMDIFNPERKTKATVETGKVDSESDERYINLIFRSFLLFSTLALVVFGIKNALIGAVIESGLNFGTAALVIVVVYVQRFVRRPVHLYRISLLVFATLFFHIATIGGNSGYKILWINIFPLAAFFLMGSREGLCWSLGFMAVIALATFVPRRKD